MASRTPSAQSSGTRPWGWGPSIGPTGLQTAPTSCRPVPPPHLPAASPSPSVTSILLAFSLPVACSPTRLQLIFSLILMSFPWFPYVFFSSFHSYFSLSLSQLSSVFLSPLLPSSPVPLRSQLTDTPPSAPRSCAFANTPKYSQVLSLGGRIVRKEWVLDCHRMRRRLPSRR